MSKRFAIIVSQFNQTITEKLLQGALNRFIELDVHKKNISVFHVPGAIEIPLIAQLTAKSKHYHAIICLGAVIRGETSHYDYVCQQVSQGCLQVMLNFEIPVIFGVLTIDNMEQAMDRVGGKEGHKGRDAADTALAMVSVVEQALSVTNSTSPLLLNKS